jgi:hypothetical protein
MDAGCPVCGGYDPWESTDAADALDQAASYLDCALTRSSRWPEISNALMMALQVLRDKQEGKAW